MGKEVKTMYEELVRTLSSCPDAEYGCSNCEYKNSFGCREKLMSDASNAIEDLTAQLEKANGVIKADTDYFFELCKPKEE